MKALRFISTGSVLIPLTFPFACVDKIPFPGDDGMAGSSSGGADRVDTGGARSSGGRSQNNSGGRTSGGTNPGPSGGASSGGRASGGAPSGGRASGGADPGVGGGPGPEPECPATVPEPGTGCAALLQCAYGSSCETLTNLTLSCDPDVGQWESVGPPTGCPPQFTHVKTQIDFDGAEHLKLWGEAGDMWLITKGTEGAQAATTCGPAKALEIGSQIYRETSGSWEPALIPIEHQAAAIHSSGPDNVWLAGQYGSVTSFDGSEWVSHDEAIAAVSGEARPCDNFLFSVHTLGPDDTWVAGSQGLFHYDGDTWTPVESLPVANDVYASSADDVWATSASLGFHSYDVFHFAGTSWEATPVGGQGGLFGRSSTDLWVTGVMGVVPVVPTNVQHLGADGGWRSVPGSIPNAQLFYVTGNAKGDTYGTETTNDTTPNQGVVRIDEALNLTNVDKTWVAEEILRDLHVTPSGRLFGVSKTSVIEFDTSAL